MDLVYEIRQAFANLDDGKYLQIRVSEGMDVWVYRIKTRFGVSVDIEHDVVVSERFATARIYTHDENILGITHHFLVLENTEESLRNEFAAICAQFADPGERGAQRKQLLDDPAGWWSRWKKLLGNSVREKTTHALLGELLVYSRLLDAGRKVVWKGPQHHSHDLECDDVDYEVKSTIARYGTAITVSGQFQLEPVEGKSLNVAFCRFEEASSKGYSIDGIVGSLESQGADRTELESKLSGIGFEAGCSARRQGYVLHEGIRIYEVDDSFPKITSESFVGEKIPDGIIQLTYQVDLSSAHYTVLR